MVNIIEKEDIQFEINDPRWELVKPEEPEKVVENPDEAEKAPEEEENKVPSLNIYEFEWSQSNGNPKNIA